MQCPQKIKKSIVAFEGLKRKTREEFVVPCAYKRTTRKGISFSEKRMHPASAILKHYALEIEHILQK